MNNTIYQLTSLVEKALHLVILGMVLFLCGYEINYAISSGVIKVQNVLMLFIYLEIMQMVNIFFSTGKIPVRYPLYIGMFALARHISFETVEGLDSLYLSASITLLSLALVALAYRDKLVNKKGPELPEL
ncbi:phosphate-starvation-inducible PsiE family protein [Candidatus Marinimicrobia bacterium]|nr:phosphate-starvation-inducible PsiE family protein [Candidatus Neomarinimicrobiota bacterium]